MGYLDSQIAFFDFRPFRNVAKKQEKISILRSQTPPFYPKKQKIKSALFAKRHLKFGFQDFGGFQLPQIPPSTNGIQFVERGLSGGIDDTFSSPPPPPPGGLLPPILQMLIYLQKGVMIATIYLCKTICRRGGSLGGGFFDFFEKFSFLKKSTPSRVLVGVNEFSGFSGRRVGIGLRPLFFEEKSDTNKCVLSFFIDFYEKWGGVPPPPRPLLPRENFTLPVYMWSSTCRQGL